MSNTTPHIFIKVTKKIDSFFEMISRLCYVICAVILIGVTIIIFLGVMNRTFFDFVWLFVEEYSALALIPASYLAMGYTLRWNQHLKMDIVVRNVPRKLQQIFGIFAAVFSFICIIYMAIAAIDWLTYTLERNVTSSGTLRTPLWAVSSTMVIGIVLFGVDMLLLIIHRVAELITGKGPLKFIDDEAELPTGEGV